MLVTTLASFLTPFMSSSVTVRPETQEVFLRAVRLAFLLFAFLCAAGVPASLARGKVQRQDEGLRMQN
jgi:hypothetical protein